LITQVAAVMTGADSAHVIMHVTDDSGTVAQAAAVYNDGVHNFKYLELSHTSGDLWEGDITSGLSAPPELVGEARDDAGNVGMSANKAVNYTAIQPANDPALKPTISIEAPIVGAVLTLNQQVNARYFCSDPTGVKSCVGSVANGTPIDTSTPGVHMFTVNATDFANRSGLASASYIVRYTFSGFRQPVDNPPVVNTSKAGSTIPVKFSLGGNQGLSVFASGYPSFVNGSCTGADDAIEQTVTAGQSSLSYDSVTGRYTYVWEDRQELGKHVPPARAQVPRRQLEARQLPIQQMIAIAASQSNGR
jgi:hypothetical protein